MAPLTSWIRQLSKSKFTRNVGSLLVGQAGRVVLQGAYFVLIARVLGVQGFGAFSGTTALVALIAPFGSLGAVNLMIRHVVRDPRSTAQSLATAMGVTFVAGSVAAAAIVFVAQWVAPRGVPLVSVLLIAVGDLLGARMVEVAGGVFVAHEQMARTAAFPLWLNGGRLLGALALFVGPWPFTILSWSLVYGLTSMSIAFVIMWSAVHHFGWARPHFRQFAMEWKEGVMFSLSLASQSIYNDIDKAMLARLSTLEATGIYTAAYRVVDMAFVPMRAVLGAAYPRFFKHGEAGLGSALLFTRRVAKPGLLYCLGVSVVLLIFAGVVPVILGNDYARAVGALRALAILPLLKGIHYLAADTLTGAGFQRLRSVGQIAVAVANVALNLVLIPAYGYWGAVIASLFSDGLLAVILWLIIIRLKGRRSPPGLSGRASAVSGGVT